MKFKKHQKTLPLDVQVLSLSKLSSGDKKLGAQYVMNVILHHLFIRYFIPETSWQDGGTESQHEAMQAH